VCGIGFRRAQVAGNLVFANVIHSELHWRSGAVNKELDRLVDGAILLIEPRIVHIERNGVQALLRVHVLELDHEVADSLTLVFLIDRELVIIALPHTAQLVDLIVILGDQRAKFSAGQGEER